MASDAGDRPVLPHTSTTPLAGSGRRNQWPAEALPLAERLQGQLAIGDREWHALKHQRPRRAAEQIAASLVQLLAADDPSQPAPTEARERAIALLEHAVAWLKREITDPGCAAHGS
jgi:hypothetical protein